MKEKNELNKNIELWKKLEDELGKTMG